MNPNLTPMTSFRKDINGLRAWAVIAVILFHFSLIGLPGGFVGVDVFFVVSGYLMTTIIVGGHEKGIFFIWKFYVARVRRILPALLVLIAVLLTLGWNWLPTPDYQTLGAQSAYSMTFLSNISYWHSTGYFDAAAEEKWLLHTWSLAVEAQFYLTYPLLITLFWKFCKSVKGVSYGILFVFSLSLIFNFIAINTDPAGAFYLLPTRAWELSAGGLVYIMSRQRSASKITKKTLLCLGWILVLCSFFIIDKEFLWPSYWTFLPVLGASLIIFAEDQDCMLTNNAVAQWLGDRSYSLYLWHWPIVVFLYFASIQNKWIWVVGAFSLSVVLANISYKFVEVPTRKYLARYSILKEVIVIGVVTSILIITAVSVKLITFPGRIQPDIELAALGALDKDPRREECLRSEKYCDYGTGKTGVIMIGDSHSGSLINALKFSAQKHNLGVHFKGRDGCSPYMGLIPYLPNAAARSDYQKCKDYNLNVRNSLNDQAGLPLIIVDRSNSKFLGSNEGYVSDDKLNSILTNKNLNRQAVINNLCSFSKDREVYVVRPIPEIGIHVPNTLSRNILFGRNSDDIKIKLTDYYQRSSYVWALQDVAAEQCGVKILNPLPYLCDDQYCYGSINGHSLYFDDDHLSEYGGKLLIPMFNQIFK